MDNPQNRRRFVRANVGEDHTARFQAGALDLKGLAMTNLSAGGCCVKVPGSEAEGLDKGMRVERLYLVHPRIPSVPLQGVVRWLLGKQPGKADGFVLVGLEFENIDPLFQETLEAYVQDLLR